MKKHRISLSDREMEIVANALARYDRLCKCIIGMRGRKTPDKCAWHAEREPLWQRMVEARPGRPWPAWKEERQIPL